VRESEERGILPHSRMPAFELPMQEPDSPASAETASTPGEAVVAARPTSVVVGLLRTMRPRQWVKNLFVLLPMVFAKELLDTGKVFRALVAFACFCAASSAVYMMNDLGDVEADRAHPKKRTRPIASGIVPESTARIAGLALGAFGIASAFALGVAPALAVGAYLILNVAYTYRLKRVAYLDVLCIAAGFELRVLGGGYSIDAPPETFLLVVTFTLAAFLGFGKRMHELRQGDGAEKQRAVLERYAEKPLSWLLYANALATIGAYVAGTLAERNRVYFGSNHLVYTSVFAAIGVFRFAHLVTNRPEAESPTEEMLEDRVFLANLVLWFVAVILVVYLGR